MQYVLAGFCLAGKQVKPGGDVAWRSGLAEASPATTFQGHRAIQERCCDGACPIDSNSWLDSLSIGTILLPIVA
jgi:hypothetical protein